MYCEQDAASLTQLKCMRRNVECTPIKSDNYFVDPNDFSPLLSLAYNV